MKITDKYVLFWGGTFSNFEPAPIEWANHIFPTSEHFFMFCKAVFFNDREIALEIMKVEHPRDAKKLGRQVKNFDADKWKEVCRDFMKQGLDLKFRQNPKMLTELLQYVDKSFVEASPRDLIWGIGLDENDPDAADESKWKGTNWLGKCLDEVRDSFLKNGFVPNE